MIRRTPLSLRLGALILVLLVSLAGCQVSGDSTAEGTSAAQDVATSTQRLAATGTATAVASPVQGGDLVSGVQRVTEIVRPAVPMIVVQTTQAGLFGQQQAQEGVGSGVIFDARGYVLTNNHVVANADRMTVVLPDNRQFDAQLVGRAPNSDVAIIKIEGDNLPVAALGDSSNVRIGEWVVAIGNALGLPGGPTVTAGVVSAVDRTIGGQGPEGQAQPAMEGLIQTDAAINPGNSGGPLVNLNGEVIGINTATIQGAEGIGFAVSINQAKGIIDQILNGQRAAFLGISGATVTPAIAARVGLDVDHGVLVVEVQADGPAAAAGIQPGDVIMSINGTAVNDIDALQRTISNYAPGDEVTVTVHRSGREQQLTVILGESPIITG